MIDFNKVLVVDDEDSVRHLLYEIVRKAGYEVIVAENGVEAVEMARIANPGVVFMDIRMPVMDGLEAFAAIYKDNPRIAVILMTAYGTVDTAVEAIKCGAFDYLIKPSSVEEIRSVLERAMQMLELNSKAVEYSQQGERIMYSMGQIIGRSKQMQELFKVVGKVSQTNVTVLVSGESGSGKGMIVKTIHDKSNRNNSPFIKVNCGAIPESLMESEFFGYEKGAFTGAGVRKLGRFEMADKGTLFLDEIGELPLTLQVKLLRVLQDKEFERVGGTQTIKVDVRIIAATNRNLEQMVSEGKFREDLYYRLKVFPIYVPPLRAHHEDVPLLIDYFIQFFAAETNRKPPILTPEAVKLLYNYTWPGNVRELANVLERAVILSTGVIDVQDLTSLASGSQSGMMDVMVSKKASLREIIQHVEKQVIATALKENEGNKVKTAKALNVSRRALLYKIKEYELGD